MAGGAAGRGAGRGRGLTGQTDGSVLLVFEHVEQRVREPGLFFGLRRSVSGRTLHSVQQQRQHVRV